MGIALISVAIVVVSFDLYSNHVENRQYKGEKKNITNELSYWENTVRQKPDYRDGYFSLALIYYQMKDFNKSSENLNKAMSLDPNFEKGKELKGILNKY